MMGGGRIEYAGAVAFGLSVSTVGNYDAGAVAFGLSQA